MSALYNSIERQLGAWQWPENHGRCIVLVVVVVVVNVDVDVVVTRSIDEIDAVVGRRVSPTSGSLSQIALLDHLLDREVGGDLGGSEVLIPNGNGK